MTEEMTLIGPKVCAVGVNYSTTPVSVRERLGIPKSRMQDALASLRKHVPHGIIVSTCNRTEVYAIDDASNYAEKAIYQFLRDLSGLSDEDLTPHLYHYQNLAAMRHLAEESAGLCSMILGEHEILGQVKQALEDAETAGMVNLPLRRLFQHAISTGRRAREETLISRNALSVSSVAVELAAKVTGNIADCQVLLIGAGEAGRLVVKALSQRGVTRISVASRSLESAQQLADSLGAVAVDIGELRTALQSSDIVISCTGSPHYVIHHELVEKAMTARPSHPLVIVDIAVPRDVDPAARHVPGVYLYDIDDLTEVLESNQEEREREVDKVMAIVSSELDHLLAWWQTLEVKPTVSALMQMAEDIRQRQLAMTLKKLPPLAQEHQDQLEAMTKAIVNKMLQNPIQCLKNNGHESVDFVQTVRELFALGEQQVP